MIFTFNDIPFEKWNGRLDEFHAWMTSEAITSRLELVIQLFTARLSGAFKEWWNSLGEYRQQEVYQTTIPLLLGEIHREFIVTTEVLGSSAPVKDLIMGWDTYYVLKKRFDISLEPRGMKWKSFYKAFTTIPHIFSLEEAAPPEFDKIKEEITIISCADSHTDFLQKCNNPLWLNLEFFVSLPFKEDVHTTPTKASHAGMPHFSIFPSCF
ncbi:unnamed protein product [Thlaspi arvense]|uniref:Retrotransposon gag domain-containing protein n=1 Tax=Thlaspi arvense TaxID=13288 RepID=A0AAU9RPS7_THLAR|nr:unnamed protein product [Thlaspi arvense]